MTPQSEGKCLELLERIAVGVERIATAVERAVEPPPPLSVGCEHPADRRTIFSGMGDSEEWVCKDCGFRYPGDVADHDASTVVDAEIKE